MSESTSFEVPETLDANPAPEDVSPADRPLSPREQIMAGIVARREAQIEADNAQATIYDREATENGLNFQQDDPDPEPVTEAAPASREPTGRQPVSTPVPVPTVPTQPQLRAVNIGGQEHYVTNEQADELIRLGMMANVALHQYQQQPTTVQPTRQPDPPRPLIDEARIRDTVKQMQYGGEDAAVEAFTGLVTDLMGRVPQQVDPNAIIHQAVSVAQQQARLEAEGVIVRQEYADIFANPQLTMLAKLNVDAIRQRNMATGRAQPDLDIYREAGNAVYDALGRSRPGSEVINPPALQAASGNVVPIRQDVIERKRNAPRATQPIDMRAPSPSAPRVPTTSEVIDQMRKARGQPSMR